MLRAVIASFAAPAARERIDDPVVVNRLYRHWRWRMFLGMYLGYVVYYLTRKNLAPALHVFSQETGTKTLDLGIIGSVF